MLGHETKEDREEDVWGREKSKKGKKLDKPYMTKSK